MRLHLPVYRRLPQVQKPSVFLTYFTILPSDVDRWEGLSWHNTDARLRLDLWWRVNRDAVG